MTFRDGDDFTRLDPFGETADERLPVRGVPLRWCISALGIALALAVLAVLAQDYRSRTITTTRVVSSGGFATVDLTGCPLGTECNYGAQPGAQLLALIAVHFPAARELSASIVFDVDTASNYRATMSVRVTGGISMLISSQCVPRGSTVTGWRSPIPSTGPADVTIVVPGAVRGCSVAVSAHIPAGVAVPGRALTALAAEPGLSSS